MNEASLMPWIITDKDGSIISGHCTCMAGVGEVCSYDGALLFAVEVAVKIRTSKTVTEEVYCISRKTVDTEYTYFS